MIVEIFATTDNGQRSGQNEDNFAVCTNLTSKSWVFKPGEKLNLSQDGALMLVADGMGGANAGEVASDLAQKVVQDQFNQIQVFPINDKKRITLLQDVIHNAHLKIIEHQRQHLETAGMGTTIVILWLTPLKAYVAWCGDSRLYVYKKGQSLKPFTDDHSYVWELVKAGNISAEDARLHPESNIITQSLGDPGAHPKPEVRVVDVTEGDRFLLCTDGLNSMLSDVQIQDILTKEDSTADASKMLIEAANAAGGRDNITVVLLDVKEASEPVKSTQTTTQELRKFIKVKNRVIVALGLILFCVVSYLVIAKAMNNNSLKKSERVNTGGVNNKNKTDVNTSNTDSIYNSVTNIKLESPTQQQSRNSYNNNKYIIKSTNDYKVTHLKDVITISVDTIKNATR